jgi:chromosome segregation ATPase
MTTPTRPTNVSSKFEEERLRAAEQSQMVYLQGQIDELRRLLKEQTNKYNWVMEQVRKAESSVSQINGLFERLAQDVNLSIDGNRRDLAGLRKEVVGVLMKVEEGLRPIRELNQQVHQLADARRQDRELTSTWMVRIEELDQRLTAWQTQFKEFDERYRNVMSRFGELATADEQIRAELRKVIEDLQIEKQSLRRQAVEAQQLVADVKPALDSLANRIQRAEEVRRDIESMFTDLPTQIKGADTRMAQFETDLKRYERLSTERFLMNQERLEEIRRQQEGRLTEMEETGDHSLRRVNAWLERLDSWIRELEQRHARTVVQIANLEQSHTDHLLELEKRDVRFITVLTQAMRDFQGEIQAQQVERGISPDK